MNDVLYIGLDMGLEYEDFLKSSASLRYRESLLMNDFIFDLNPSEMFGGINKSFLRELMSEQIGFANCFLSNSEFKTITIDSLTKNKKDIKILDILESKRKYNKFLKEKL